MRSHSATYDINFEFQSPLWDSNVVTFLPQRTAPIRGFQTCASSILMDFVIPLENKDMFKQSIYLDI